MADVILEKSEGIDAILTKEEKAALEPLFEKLFNHYTSLMSLIKKTIKSLPNISYDSLTGELLKIDYVNRTAKTLTLECFKL